MFLTCWHAHLLVCRALVMELNFDIVDHCRTEQASRTCQRDCGRHAGRRRTSLGDCSLVASSGVWLAHQQIQGKRCNQIWYTGNQILTQQYWRRSSIAAPLSGTHSHHISVLLPPTMSSQA